MDKERHHEILKLLNNPETTQADKADLLDELRTGTNALYASVSDLEQKQNEAKSQIADLTLANGKLFLKLNETEAEEDKIDEPQPVKSLDELLKGKEITY